MRVLVVGSASYVASFFLAEAGRRGWDVFGLSRDKIRQGALYGRAASPPMAVSHQEAMALGSVDAIVNFAYPRDLGTFKIHGATRRLLGDVRTLARSLSPRTVVQVSTKTVFGYTFAQAPRPAPVRWAAGDRYVETKALAEWLFLLAARRAPYAPVILRLGNVVGPGAYWISEIARRVLFAEPVGRGRCNATYGPNVADYLATLVTTDPGTLRAFGPFHHLGEFSTASWASFIDPVAAALGVPPVYRDAPVRHRPASVRAAAATTAAYLAMLLPGSWQERAEDLRRAVRRRSGTRGDHGLGEPDVPPGLHERFEFRSHTLPGWSPRFGLAAALGDTLAWVRAAGYVPSDEAVPLSGAAR